MQLLDLPAEIFQRIVAVIVKKHGLQEAWKARGTNKAFRDYITYDVLAAPSLYAYNKNRTGREILKHNLAKFLYVRSSNLNGFVRVHVPNFIRDLMTAMSQWVPDDAASAALRKVLCELFVRNHADALKCIQTEVNKLGTILSRTISATGTANLIAAAAATGDLLALRHFATPKKHLLWYESPSFGFPLTAAVYADQFALVKAIAKQALTNQVRSIPGNPYPEHLAFRSAISTAIELDRHAMVPHLLSIYSQAFGPSTEPCMHAWLTTAIKSNSSSTLRLLLTTPTQATRSTLYTVFETLCHESKPTLLPLLFSAHISPSHLFLDRIHNNTYPLLTAINITAHPSIGPVITALIKLGANTEGPRYLAGLDCPLRAATRYGRNVACLALLEGGANPWAVQKQGWVRAVRKMYAENTRVGVAIRKALVACERPVKEGGGGFLVG